jgi:regulator of telomere elongation helicase 1
LERWIDELESVPTIYDILKAKLGQAKVNTELREYRAIMITIRAFAQFLESRRNSPEIQL